ncbi:MAG: glycosyltransferase family 9 protein, partial [Gemmatimonadota bacterium]|nr:glycosyltransferase family 9 protein [Gemmatimonadota bacterium]
AEISTASSPAPDAQRSTPERQESLVIQTSFLGDAVLTTPLISELAMRGPVDVVATPGAAKVLENNPSIRNLFVYDKRGAHTGLAGLWRLAQLLRGRRSALTPMTGEAPAPGAPKHTGRRARRIAYLAQGSVRSATLAVLGGYRERIGFSTSAGRSLYTKRVAYREDRHHAERLWSLAFPLEDVRPPAGALQPRLYPSESDENAVDALLEASAIGTPFIVLAPGSVWGTKRWPYYAELARALTVRWPIAIVGSAEDAEAARAIVDAAGMERTLDAVGKLSLLGSAELIGRSALIVTNDSSPQHLASAIGTPTITMFGPTVPEFGFGPLAPRSMTIGHEGLDCRPCDHHGPQRCPLGHWRCMRELGVERVLASIDAVITH